MHVHNMISNMLLSLLFLFLFLSLLYILSKKKSRLNPPPGPLGLPFIGNLHQLDQSSLHTSLWDLTKPYGPIVSLRFGFNSAVVISSVSLAEEVLKNQDLAFCSRPSFIGQRKLTYDGQDIALSPYNEHWREMRKIFTLHLFSPKRVQSFRRIREDEVSTAMKTIHDLALSAETVNLSAMMKNLTTKIMMKVCFGKMYHCRDGLEIKKVLGLLNEVQAYLVDLYVSDIWPGLPFVGLIDRLTGKMNQHDKCFRDLDSFYQQLIDERLNTQKDKSYEESEDDLIDIILLVKDKLFSMTHDHIKAMLMDVLVAGTDTSAATVVWAMASLIKNPKVMEKAQEEVRNVMGKSGNIAEDNLLELPYLKAIIKETLRLYPPAPLLVPRETRKDVIVHEYQIKKKTLVYVNAWAIGRDPKSWENPGEFLPERFMEGCDIDFKGNDFELIPFGAGRRICPGMSIGLAMVELLLANLLYLFDWELLDGVRKEDIDFDAMPGITMHKKNELCLLAYVHF